LSWGSGHVLSNLWISLPLCFFLTNRLEANETIVRLTKPRVSREKVLAFELKVAQRPQGECDAAHVAGLGDVGEARRGQLVSQAFGHAGVTQRLVHQHQGEHLQQAVLDVLLQLGDLAAQVVQHRRQRRTRWTGTNGKNNVITAVVWRRGQGSRASRMAGNEFHFGFVVPRDYYAIMNPNTRAFDVPLLWDVLNKYKAELVVSSSVVDGGKYNSFHGAKQWR